MSQSERANGCMNVICDRRYDAALAEARAADAELALRRATGRGMDDLPPFFGVPCSIKEFFSMPGLRQTSGVVSRAAFVPSHTAPPVARLRAAGFIILYNTNTSELGMWYASDNPVWGRSNNAYDHARIVGGSSGGEAAVVSAGGVPVGIGSDIGGSIRIPAGFNGCWGHKVTGGLISNAGQVPTTFQRFMVTGPITRYSDDLLPMLELLRGPDGLDTSCIDMTLVDVNLPLARAVRESSDTHLQPRRKARVGGDASPSAPSSPPALFVVDRTDSGGGGAAGRGGTTVDAIVTSMSPAGSMPAFDLPPGAGAASTTALLHAEGAALRAVAAARRPGGADIGAAAPPALRPADGGRAAEDVPVPSSLVGRRVLPDDLADVRHIARPPITAWSTVTVWTVKDLMRVQPPLATRIQPAVAAAVAATADTLVREYGCAGVRELELPELAYAFDMWTAVLAASDQQSFRDMLAEGYGGSLDIGWELVRWSFGASRSTLPALILALIEDIPAKLFPARQARLAAECVRLKRRIYDTLSSTNGVLLLPMHPTTAPAHDVPLLRPFNVAYTQLFNVLETPVTVVPVGLDEEGLPVCVQVVGAHCFDRLCIAVGQALEHAGAAGWIPPHTVNPCPRCSMTAPVVNAATPPAR